MAESTKSTTPQPAVPTPGIAEASDAKQLAVQETAFAADIATEHADKAVAAATEAEAAAERARDRAIVCPHCGTTLQPHHDASGALHCPSERCRQCCFLPADETSEGAVREKMEARYCPLRVVAR